MALAAWVLLATPGCGCTYRPTTDALSQLATIQQAVRSVFDGHGSYDGLTAKVLIDSGRLPSRWTSESTMRHAFKGGIRVGTADAGLGPGSGFSVRFEDVPKYACVKMVTSDLGRGLQSVEAGGLVRIRVDNPPLFSPADAAKACSRRYNPVTWVFD